MRSTTLSRLLLCLSLLSIVLALPAAAGKRRSVRSGKPGSVTVDVKGRVLDVGTKAPIAFAAVRGGGKTAYTAADGRFVLKNLPEFETLTLIVERSGYTASTTNVTANLVEEGTLTIELAPTPTVRVRKTDNTTYDIDFESLQFGYVLTFGGYASGPSAEFCRADDGTAVTIDRAQMSKIVGPATKAAQPNCCAVDELMKVNIQMKNGPTFDAVFHDGCFGYRVDLIGREHVSGTFQYISFGDVAEVSFP